MSKIGFIGLGVMGFPMAGHLSKVNSVAVFNRTKEKIIAWQRSHDGIVCESPEHLGEICSQVYLCIGDDDDVRKVVAGEKGLLNSLKSGSIIIDHTTTSASLSREMYETCKKLDIDYIDAPVSGGQVGAEQGELTIMAGGSEEAYDKAKSVFSVYSKFSKLMGGSGSGQLTKMVNQICIAGLVQGLAEGIHFSQKAGLDTKEVIDVISKGAAQSWQMVNRWETMLLDQYEHGFAVDHMRKDLRIAIEEAQSNSAKLEVTELIDFFYKEIQNMGGNRWDTSSLLRRLQNND
ncbi:MAG: NAD(P)-dependent oxidoreductase [Pseudomonadota bacterium]|nr:NAD(P)-dependent oxidoreductase [Pseudomonadota bacterium]